jgi:hypothetical protein
MVPVPVHAPHVGIGISKETALPTVTKAKASAANRNTFLNMEGILFRKSVRHLPTRIRIEPKVPLKGSRGEVFQESNKMVTPATFLSYMTYNTVEILMPRFRLRGMLAKSASEDLFRHTLSRIPSVYGKLAYFASLKDSSTGSYRHHGLTATFGREDAANALKSGHEDVFRDWLNASLSDKYDDLIQYFAAQAGPCSEYAGQLLENKFYRNCVPPSASPAEKEAFAGDLEVLLIAFSYEGADGKPGQGS